MRTSLRFFGIVSIIAAVVCLACSKTSLDLLWAACGLFLAGMLLLAVSQVLDRLTYIQFLLESPKLKETKRAETEVGEFEKLDNVEGQAMCVGCRKTSPRAGMYYSKSLDAYYHPRCLARDRHT